MNLNIYAIQDQAVKAYTNPFFQQTDEAATRLMRDQINSQDGSMLSKYPAQFALYRLATYDFKTGEVIPDQPTLVADGLSLQDPNLKTNVSPDQLGALIEGIQEVKNQQTEFVRILLDSKLIDMEKPQ